VSDDRSKVARSICHLTVIVQKKTEESEAKNRDTADQEVRLILCRLVSEVTCWWSNPTGLARGAQMFRLVIKKNGESRAKLQQTLSSLLPFPLSPSKGDILQVLGYKASSVVLPEG